MTNKIKLAARPAHVESLTAAIHKHYCELDRTFDLF